ncbi:conserved hypothetical protein [Tenacibaculum maritimum]|uniref:hypothetical protein n=1 Tax=Tenacibaculum maritimum TaxID=107401 RepID=UPI0012E48DA5|nr:hypothetical protein [Tenacibaculum maritimum]CAA0144563.1 conserved hypothetical protein [Tenacibaculum maritimum]CAA0220910.1 conserved hypothetical protein [Tenacibaculum maritimum]CAA0253971.1 conserved hypothetical protein [Tenacibaculum maritimum]
MEYLIEILKYIGPFIGVFIGWILTRKNDNDKIKYSEIRQIKRSLYVLLEIRNQIALTKRMDKYLNILTNKLNLKLNEYTEEKIEPEQFKGLLNQILPSLIGDNFQTNLKTQFDKCIDNLSEIDPVLTFRINGKQNVQDYLSSWENESKNYFKMESIEDFKSTVEHFKPKIVDEIRNDIENIILDLAELISKKEVERIKEIITEPEELEMEIDIDEYIETMFSGILQIEQ